MAETLLERLDPEFGKSLRRVREGKGISVLDLSEQLGVPTLQIRCYERGDESPDPNTYTDICKVLGTNEREGAEASKPPKASEPAVPAESGFSRGMQKMRALSGLSLSQVAAKSGIPESRLQAIESATVEPEDHERTLVLSVLREAHEGQDESLNTLLLKDASYEQLLDRLRELGKQKGLI